LIYDLIGKGKQYDGRDCVCHDCRHLSGLFPLSLVSVVIAGPIRITYPLFALLFARIFLGRVERINPRLVLGATFVVGGLALIAIGKLLFALLQRYHHIFTQDGNTVEPQKPVF